MGDMADLVNDSSLNSGENDHGSEVFCRSCGEGNLHWKKTKGNRWWMVGDDGNWHSCQKLTGELAQ